MSYQNKAPKAELAIDIETVVIPATQADVDKYIEEWQPPGSVKKPETIAEYKLAAIGNAKQEIEDKRRFALGGKRMISCAIGLVSQSQNKVVDIQSWQGDDLREIAAGLAHYLNAFNEYRLIGYNCNAFDLPEIAKSFYTTGIRPRYRPGKWDIVDLCSFPLRGTKLKDASTAFGIEIPETTGADVAAFYEKKDWAAIKNYNEHDVMITGQLYLGLTSIFTF